MSNRRRAFTLIELMVAVGIIAVLAAMFTVGIRSMTRRAGDDDTRVYLQNLRGMVGELRATVGANRPLPYPDLGPDGNYWQWPGGGSVTSATQIANAQLDFWTINYRQGTGIAKPMPAPTNFSTTDPCTAIAVQTTHRVMQVLARCPNNRKALANLPTKHMVTLKELVLKSGKPGSAAKLVLPDDVPMLRDAWNNPIIFVPATGLSGVKLGGQGNYVIRSSGTYLSTDPAVTTKPLTPQDRPFFASAGADGDFVQGDDNLYSFQE